jgi:hypothetical protein
MKNIGWWLLTVFYLGQWFGIATGSPEYWWIPLCFAVVSSSIAIFRYFFEIKRRKR